MPFTPVTFFSDTFTTGGSTALYLHTPEIGGAWVSSGYVANGGKMVRTDGGSLLGIWNETTLPAAGFTLSWSFTQPGTASAWIVEAGFVDGFEEGVSDEIPLLGLRIKFLSGSTTVVVARDASPTQSGTTVQTLAGSPSALPTTNTVELSYENGLLEVTLNGTSIYGPTAETVGVGWRIYARLYAGGKLNELTAVQTVGGTGQATLPVRVKVGGTEQTALPVRINVGQVGIADLPVRVVVGSVGLASLPVRIRVVGVGQSTLSARISVVSVAVASGAQTVTDGGAAAAVWGAVVIIGGVDVSASIIGEIIVEAEENAARIADLTLHQPPGTVIVPTAWVGRPVRIYLADLAGGAPANALPLFTGIVDLPVVQPLSGMIRLRCTDNRQGIVGALTKAAIDTLLPGARYSPAVFDAGATSWQYANDRLATLAAAIDLSPTGVLRLTPWAAKEAPDLSFGADAVLDTSVAVDIAERSGLVNEVAVNFGYRFPRVKAEGYLVSYDYVALSGDTFGHWIHDGGSVLQRAAVTAAIEAAGGTIVEIEWTPLPSTPQMLGAFPDDGYWLPNPPVDALMCRGFAAVVAFDYAQQTDETHRITVANAASVAVLGALREDISGALEGVYEDPVAMEHSILLYRKKITGIPPNILAPVVVGLTNSVNGALTADSDRAAANAAMEALIAVAATKIYASHRRHTVSAAVPCNPVLDVDQTVAIVAQGVVASGKLRRVVHRLNPDSGSAISEFDMAICSAAGVGIIHPEDAIEAPAGTEAGTSNELAAPAVTWNGELNGDKIITISFAGVEEAERAKAAHAINSAFAAPLFEDFLEVTL